MKRKKLPLIALLTVAVLGVSLVRNQAAQANLRHLADTGLITVGPNQKIRLTAAAADFGGALKIRFTVLNYGQGECAGNVCRAAVVSRTETEITNLAPGETAFVNGDPDQPIIVGRSRIVVEGNKPMLVNLQIVDTVTGQVMSSQTQDVDFYR